MQSDSISKEHSTSIIGLFYPSILVYLVAIRHHHLELGYHDPLVDKPLLTYLCKGIPGSQRNHMRVRLPPTAAMLTSSHPALSHSTPALSHSNIRDKPAMGGSSHLGIPCLPTLAPRAPPTTSSGGTSAWLLATTQSHQSVQDRPI